MNWPESDDEARPQPEGAAPRKMRAVGPTSKEEDLDRLAHYKATLFLFQEMRAMKANCQLVSKVTADLLCINYTTEAGIKYAKRVELQPGRDHGSPHTLVWRDLVKGVVEDLRADMPQPAQGASEEMVLKCKAFTE